MNIGGEANIESIVWRRPRCKIAVWIETASHWLKDGRPVRKYKVSAYSASSMARRRESKSSREAGANVPKRLVTIKWVDRRKKFLGSQESRVAGQRA